MFNILEKINKKPKVFEFYTAEELWNDPYTSKMMLKFHLDETVDISSRNGVFLDDSAAWMIKRFELNSEKKVIDFGCGPGHYTTRLARSGARVTGVDFSNNSLEYAKAKALKEKMSIEYVYGNYLDYQPRDEFDLIIMIMCDYCALNPEQRKKLLNKFRGILKKDGMVLFDVYTLNAFEVREEGSRFGKAEEPRFWASEEYFEFLNTFKYENEKVILDKYSIFGKTWEKTIYNWLSYFTKESLEKEIREAGLIVHSFFNDVKGSPLTNNSFELAVLACEK